MSHAPSLPPRARLRPFREADAPAVFALIHATIDASYAGVYPERAIAFFKRNHALDEILRRDVGDGQTLDYWVGRKSIVAGEPPASAING
jgi:hypothetical protein